MLKNEIKSFEKQLKDFSGGEIKIFDEIVEMIINLIKIEVTANQDELIKRVTKNIKFESINDVQEFLTSYFNLQNEIIRNFEFIEGAESDSEFDKEIFQFTKTLLQTIPKKELRETLMQAMLKVHAFVLDMYNIEIYDDEERTLKSVNDTFKDEDLSTLFLSTTAVITLFSEDIKMSFDEMVKLSSPFFIFCMAMNDMRKNNYLQSQENKKNHDEPANDINYNVGRNDPCPCGSGKKYKKCCLNKQQTKPLDLISLQEPTDTPDPLSEKEVTEFYTVWSRFVNYVSKLYSEVYEKKYIAIYKKDKFEKYLVSNDAIKGTYCLEVRDFLTTNFYRLVDDFIRDNKVSKKHEKELLEFRDFYKSSKYHSFEKFTNGDAVFWDTQNSKCYYVNRCYDNLSSLLPKHTMFNTILLPFRGRIVCDGIIGQYNVDMGVNIQKSLKEEYENIRDNISFKLEKNEKQIEKIYQLKISIKGAKPPIWRRVLIESITSFYGLHAIIQNIFNWDDSHPYEFEGRIANYTEKESIEDGFGGFTTMYESDKFSIETELKNEKDKITYTYDFGDHWEHTILLEKILIADETITYPTCTGGRREGPLEDCGGIYSYNEIVEALEKPTSDNQYLLEQYEEWFDDFDPSSFQKELVNMRLKGIQG